MAGVQWGALIKEGIVTDVSLGEDGKNREGGERGCGNVQF